ncbi:MAG: type II toxin-antitoxin system ParD family antitoxin [Acidobacteriaceae bacterium]
MNNDLEYERKLAALRAAIKEGEESGYAEPGSFDRIRKELGLSPIENDDPAPDQREGHSS